MGAENPIRGRWPEFVDDLWQRRLPHLRQEVYGDGMFMFDPTTGRYGFQEGSDYGSEDEFMTDLMNEPEYQGEGEGDRVGGVTGRIEEDGASGGGGADDSFEELSESELEPPNISHSYDLDQASGDEEEKDGFGQSSRSKGGGASAGFLDQEDCEWSDSTAAPVLML